MTRDGLKALFLEWVAPVMGESRDFNQLSLGQTGTTYSRRISEVETFLRLLWGLGPYLKSYPDVEIERLVMATIVEGIDQESPHYWGKLSDNNQLMVEMPPLCLLFMHNPRLWEALNERQQVALADWLSQINDYQMPENNWLFFRIIVNSFVERFYQQDMRAQREADFAKIESFYIGDGWYFDGNPNQTDYYISFAFHYYSLIYAHFFGAEDPERRELLKERASIFAQDFEHWFTVDGKGLPYGRSLTYRFAQVAFWSACVFADVPGVDLGNAKDILHKHLTYWSESAMRNADGILSIGYAYENLIMSEEYNGPGSPYWGLKTFLLLAVSSDHRFWQVEALRHSLTTQKRLPQANLFLAKNQLNTEIQAYTNGQSVKWLTNGVAKYSKFVYSSTFGFNVSRGGGTYNEGAFDSTLALSEDGYFFKTKCVTKKSVMHSDYIETIWQPWEDVLIRSLIIPVFPWHIRIHKIETARDLIICDGGFANSTEELTIFETEDEVHLTSDSGTTALKLYSSGLKSQISPVLANVNIYFPRSRFAYAEGNLTAGKHQLVTAFLGSCEKAEVDNIRAPNIEQNKETSELIITYWHEDTQQWCKKKLTINEMRELK